MQHRDSKTASNKDASGIYVLAGKPAINERLLAVLCVRGAVHLATEFGGPLSFFFASLMTSSLSSILTWKIYSKTGSTSACGANMIILAVATEAKKEPFLSSCLLLLFLRTCLLAVC